MLTAKSKLSSFNFSRKYNLELFSSPGLGNRYIFAVASQGDLKVSILKSFITHNMTIN